jgi:hypothetical protein
MKYLKDKKIISLLVILFLFTVVYFVAANKVSYAFSDNADVTHLYNKTITIIKKCALTYAKKNPDIFKKESIAYIKVQDLIDNDLLVANSDGQLINPLDSSTSLNDNIIKLKKEDGKIDVTVDS